MWMTLLQPAASGLRYVCTYMCMTLQIEHLFHMQVGLSEDDKVYIACGENRIKYNGIKLLTMEQLKEYTNVLDM